MDYKLLLKKYIKHVRQSEGVDFIDKLNDHMASDVEFTLEEEVELKLLNGTLKSVDIEITKTDWYKKFEKKEIQSLNPMFQDAIKELKQNGIELIYGSGNLPLAYRHESDKAIEYRLIQIGKDIPRDQWFNYKK